VIALAALLADVGGLDEVELTSWIERRWVRAEAGPDGWLFHEVDVARVRLIVEIRRDCALDDEAMPVVLSLLDQVYRLRRQLAALSGAVADQPSELRDRILTALGERGPGRA
jgi:chaperone modulatory protein CbpM